MSASTNMGHVTSFEVWEIETARRQFKDYYRGMPTECPCGRMVAPCQPYRCLYCDIWFCEDCAGEHFGETKAAFLERKAKECQ